MSKIVDPINYRLQQQAAEKWFLDEIERLKSEGYIEISPGTWESPDKKILVSL